MKDEVITNQPSSIPASSLLVVDDNSMNRIMLSRYITKLGYRSSLAENGRQALEKLQAEPYDLVLLDVQMPEMDGYTVLEYLKADPCLRDIPVIMISAVDELESVVKCIELGAQDYLPKPFNPVLLRARLTACLERKWLRDQEVDYLQQVGRVTAAAAAIKGNTFQSESLDEVARRPDELGQLALVFQEMARQVYAREQQLQRQVQQLRIVIDQARNASEVAEIPKAIFFSSCLAKRTNYVTGSRQMRKTACKRRRPESRMLKRERKSLMHWRLTPYAIPEAISGAILIWLVIVTWRRRSASGASPFIVILLAATVYSLSYMVELGSTDLSAAIFWNNVAWLGSVLLPPAWLAFALQYTGRASWLTRRMVVLLAIVPLVTLLLVWTNTMHGLISSNNSLDSTAPFSALVSTPGAWFWVFLVYAYTLFLLGALVIGSFIRTLMRSASLYHGQVIALLIAVIAPWVGNAIYLFRPRPLSLFDPTPLAFTISGLVMAWSLFRYRMLDLAPVARNAVVESMSDAVLVLDQHNQITDLNPAAQRITVQRLLKPRTPLDCPACRLCCTPWSGVRPAPTPVRPWREVKSRRGAPKRVNTEGFACPNQQCPYSGITDAQIHALVGDGTHGRAERIQTFRCQACRTTFSARRHTPLYRLKTPSQQVAVVLTALAEGLDASAAERIFGYRDSTITTWLTRAGEHAQTLHKRSFSNLRLPHLQLDELRTRLRSYQQVLWLWLAIDPCTKILPVLHLGPRTQNVAHLLIHSLRQILASDCLPLFTSDGLHVYFYALTAHFGQWREVGRRGQHVRQWQVAAGLIYGQVKKSYRRRKLVRVTHVMRLGTEVALKVALQGLGFSGRLNTAFIERVNLTVRHGIAALARRSWATAQQSPPLLAHLYDFLTSKPGCLRHSVSQQTSRKNALPSPSQ